MERDARAVVSEVRRLGSPDAKERGRAREALGALGPAATWHLIQAAYPRGPKARSEALEVLVGLHDPAAADLFVETLEDEDSACRWLAAEGLAGLGRVGLARSLEILSDGPDSAHLLQGLHHVLGKLQEQGFDELVAPVLRAYREAVPESRVPIAAYEALNQLRGRAPAQTDRGGAQ